VWGAVVRATGSGAGCGGHWPLCNGQLAPSAPSVKTLIEYTHRVMSGLSLVGVGWLAIWAFRRCARGSPVRKSAALAAAFLCIEALLGAGLVLFDYVAGNVSLGRAFYLALQHANTRPARHARGYGVAGVARRTGHPMAACAWRLLAALPVVVLLGMTGAIAALGDTLFPASSLRAGFSQDFSAAANFLVRLRGLHPALRWPPRRSSSMRRRQG